MERMEYENTKDYKKAMKILKEFVEEVLEGDINKLKTYCFDDLTKFIGDICDPDMYLIVQAIYIVLWGDVYELTFENMGPWDMKGTYAFRGDTMNSFGSLFGKEGRGNSLGYRAKFFGADKNPELWNKIETFYRMYHSLGNFIVIPNRGSVSNGINGARANYYDCEFCEGMRDYFDWFLIAIDEYQKKVKTGNIHLNKMEMQLQRNPEYNPHFLEVSEWEERFFLKQYFEEGSPRLLFSTPLERRLMITAAPEDRHGEGYYEEEEYLELVNDYLDKSQEVIEYRANRMVEFLNKKLRQEGWR